MLKYMQSRKNDYWSNVTEKWKEDNPQRLWRLYADALNSDLLAGLMSLSSSVDLLLKTDMFDEAFGPGLLSVLQAKSRRTIGVDIAHPAVTAACSRNRSIEGTTADVRLLPFKRETFDIVVSFSSLDHFQTRREIIAGLREIRRILKPGGELLITMDNPMNPLVALRNILPFSLLNRLGIIPYYVGATVDHRYLRRILEGIGFRVTISDAFMHFPRVLAVFLAGIMDKHADQQMQKSFLRLLKAFEHISRLPTRYLTGHFIVIKAVKS
jgi:SAM-dependent methyltransferase